ncbi:MAG: class I SAM-dependent methyltransferase [Candidatus Bathyarchaeales archaeon]
MNEWNKKREIMRRYDLTAHLYDMRYADEQKQKIEAALEEITIKKHCLVLDVGCGTGILFNYFVEKAKSVVGLDISRKTLQEAKKRAKNLENVYLVLADADNMPFRENFFDYVFGVTVLQNMPAPAKTLMEVRRVAEGKAKIIVTGMKKAFTLEQFQQLLSAANLKAIAVKVENLNCYVAVCVKL